MLCVIKKNTAASSFATFLVAMWADRANKENRKYWLQITGAVTLKTNPWRAHHGPLSARCLPILLFTQANNSVWGHHSPSCWDSNPIPGKDTDFSTLSAVLHLKWFSSVTLRLVLSKYTFCKDKWLNGFRILKKAIRLQPWCLDPWSLVALCDPWYCVVTMVTLVNLSHFIFYSTGDWKAPKQRTRGIWWGQVFWFQRASPVSSWRKE